MNKPIPMFKAISLPCFTTNYRLVARSVRENNMF